MDFNSLDKQSARNNDFRFEGQQRDTYDRLAKYVSSGIASFYRDACLILWRRQEFASTTHLVGHLYREIESAIRSVLLPFPYKTSKEEAKDRQKAEIRRIAAQLKLEPAIIKFWESLGGNESTDKNDYRLHRLAHRNNVAEPRPFDPQFLLFCRQMDDFLSTITSKFAANFTQIVDPLIKDFAAKPNPNSKDIERYLQNFPHTIVAQREFFKSIPLAWLPMLYEAAVFSNPRKLLSDGHIPEWPQSIYLARAANEYPELVAKIITEIPTDNFYILIDFCDAALAMPPDYAAQVAKTFHSQSSLFGQVHFLDKFIELVLKLAKEQHIADSLQLMKAILLGPVVLNTDENNRITINDWYYNEICKRALPTLFQVANFGSIQMLGSVLEECLKVEYRSDQTDDIENESSYWRDRIPYGYDRDTKQILTSNLWETAKQAIELDPTLLTKLVNYLDQCSFQIFKRIAMYLIFEFDEPSSDLVNDWAMRSDYIDNFSMRREYRLILEKHAQRLNEECVAQIIGQIEASPRSKDEEDGKKWQLYWLTPLRDVLSAEWRQRHETLIAEIGESRLRDYEPLFEVSTFWAGPTAPLDKDYFLNTDFDQIIQYLREWQPDNASAFGSHSPEGLGRVLAEAVSEAPVRYADNAHLFIDVEPTYVRHLLAGLDKAVGEKRFFDWNQILILCHWVAEQSNNTQTRENDDQDVSWKWTRGQISNLLRAGLNHLAIPVEFANKVWSLLRVLVKDLDPIASEETYGENHMNPFEWSINNNRGKALNTIFQFMVWWKDMGNQEEQLFTEVKRVIEHSLGDPVLSIRAIYGRYLYSFAYVDRNWLIDLLPRIFPVDSDKCNYKDVAWQTFLYTNQPNVAAYELLKVQYFQAVDEMNSQEVVNWLREERNQLLANHLTILYGWGVLGSTAPDELMTKFFTSANPDLQAYAIGRMGHALKDSDKAIDPQIIQRLVELWEQLEGKLDDIALKEFGWWFISKKLVDSWAIAQLQKVLWVTHDIEADYLVVEHLATLLHDFPVDVVRSLDLVANNQSNTLLTARDEVKQILKSALALGSEVRTLAIGLINRLIADGNSDFRDILPSSDQ